MIHYLQKLTRHCVSPKEYPSPDYVARLWAGDGGNHAVQIVTGNAAPHFVGEGYHFTTPGGRLIHHPNAYRWPKVYHGSTLVVNVGQSWFRANSAHYHTDENGLRSVYMPGHIQRVHGLKVYRAWLDRRRVCLVVGPGWTYHANRGSNFDRKTARQAVREAIKAIHRQRDEQKRMAKLKREQKARDIALLAEAEGVRVTLEDSVRAGNCRAGSESWAIQHGLDPAKDYAAQELLQMANGQGDRVRLAISAAIHRHRAEVLTT